MDKKEKKKRKPDKILLRILFVVLSVIAIGLSLLVSRLDALAKFSSIIATVIIVACFITELFGPLMTKYMIFKANEAHIEE